MIRSLGIARARELEKLGVSREYLRLLAQRGMVQRVSRGLYAIPGVEISANHSLAEAAKRVPQGVVCLLSALRFHGLTTQSPFQVWLTIPVKARHPRAEYPPLRIVRASGKALTSGIEEHRVEKVTTKVYSAAKTVVDCFKYRNKIGLDVAIEALRDCRRQRKASMDELWRYARICRMSNVMRSYMEAVV